ncbi:MAG: hypothetical protein HY321_17010 [Armatimonadetes bacterium]|nr:hypothetical protein [Armatimonadota bacterium]
MMSHDPAPELAAHWPLPGSARDVSGNGHHGAARHVEWSPCGALFDGRSRVREARLYRRVLRAEEVAALFAAER